MKTMRPVFATAAVMLLAPAALHAQKAFEGTVAFSMEMASQMGPMSVEVEHFVKGDKVRQVMKGLPMGEMITLMEMGSDNMTMLLPSQKMYMTMDIAGITGEAGNSDETPTIRKTGRNETIAGHECEHVEIASSQGTIDMCVATGLGYYFMGGTGGGGGRMGGGAPSAGFNPKMETEVRKVFADGFFPLKVTATQNGQTMSMVATHVERKTLPDDLFVIPADYTKMAGRGGY